MRGQTFLEERKEKNCKPLYAFIGTWKYFKRKWQEMLNRIYKDGTRNEKNFMKFLEKETD